MNWDKFFRVLQFLRITDESGNLSVSTLVLAAVVWRLLRAPEIDVAAVGTLFASVAGYQIRRFVAGTNNTETATDELAAIQKAVSSLETKVTGIQLGGQLRR